MKETDIADIRAKADRVEKELYVGRENRQPVLVRLSSCERIVGWMVYVATALLISTILAVGGLLWTAAVRSRSGAAAAADAADRAISAARVRGSDAPGGFALFRPGRFPTRGGAS